MPIIQPYCMGLFARNFLLLLSLMLCCLALWFAVFLQSGVTVRAYEMSQRIISSINLTTTALRYAQDHDQSQLLADLSRHESLDVHLRKRDDLYSPLPDENYWRLIEQHLHAALGAESVIAWEVNQQPAFWVSFTSNGQPYWLAFERQKIRQSTPVQWASSILTAALLSLLGALISTSYLNRPLNRLARFAKSLSAGHAPAPLPETGTREIRLVNKSFNRMAQDLSQMQSDREMMLAGLSHDLRTPLTRMRLEIEMSTLPEITRRLIDTDLEQVDHSINKLIEYARASDETCHTVHKKLTAEINISEELTVLLGYEIEKAKTEETSFKTDIANNLHARLEPFNLQRILTNLIENAKRYGRNQSGHAEIAVRLARQNRQLLLEISDTGAGITEQETETFLRPFSRGNQARTDCVGTGLGLAIVERLVKQAQGTISLLARPGKGLVVRIFFPAL